MAIWIIALLIMFQIIAAPVVMVAVAKGAYKVALPLGILLMVAFFIVQVPPMESGLPGG